MRDGLAGHGSLTSFGLAGLPVPTELERLPVQKIDCDKRRPRRRLESGQLGEPARLRTFENPARFFDELEEFPPLLYLLKDK